MRKKSTDDLREELMEAPSIGAYLRNNADILAGQGIQALLGDLFRRSGLSKAAAARRAGMSEVYLHQVFAGRRNPSRDRLLCLCVVLEAALDETQQLLQQAAYAQLYPRRRRDAIISYGILHRETLGKINEHLLSEGEKALS